MENEGVEIWGKLISCGVLCVILRFAVLVEHRIVTDTDRQTDGHRPMASTADA